MFLEPAAALPGDPPQVQNALPAGLRQRKQNQSLSSQPWQRFPARCEDGFARSASAPPCSLSPCSGIAPAHRTSLRGKALALDVLDQNRVFPENGRIFPKGKESPGNTRMQKMLLIPQTLALIFWFRVCYNRYLGFDVLFYLLTLFVIQESLIWIIRVSQSKCPNWVCSLSSKLAVGNVTNVCVCHLIFHRT